MRLVGHHLVSDLSMLVRNGLQLPEGVEYVDTEVGAHWLWPDQKEFGGFALETLALRMTNMAHWRKTLGEVDMDDFEAMSNEDLAHRCGGDAEAAFRLAQIILPQIDRTGLRKVWDLAMSVLPILAEVGGRGMALKTDELRLREQTLRAWLTQEREDLEKTLGVTNLNSDAQVAEALFSHVFKATPLKETSLGYSVGKLSLMWARYKAREYGDTKLVELLSRILDWNEKYKLHSTYYLGWVQRGGERVHAVYHLGRTGTGRLSCYDYNLQNIPPIARELVIPSPGYDWIVQADFKMLEICVAAHLSQDPVMTDWVQRGLDIHSLQAARVMGLPEPKTPAEFAQFKTKYKLQRDIGKMANFATLYGVSDESLSWQVFEQSKGETYITHEEAARYIEAFKTTFAGFMAHVDRVWALIQNDEWITTDFGRRWVFEKNNAGKRQGMNYPVQSEASDLVLLALLAIATELKRGGWRTRIIGEVHDSFVFEVPDNELQHLFVLLKQLCENIDTSDFNFQLRVPLRVDIQYGTDWRRLSEYPLHP